MSIVFFGLAVCVLLTALFVLLRDPARKRRKSATEAFDDDEILRELLLEMEQEENK